MDYIRVAFAKVISELAHWFFAIFLKHNAVMVSPNSSSVQRIVIVGGSFAGVETAHRVLKQASKITTSSFKVTLISRDSHFYWTLAVPRGVIPEQLSDDQLFQPIEPGFLQYPTDKFQFVLGSITAIDAESNSIDVSDATGKALHLKYDTLILATGSRLAENLPFKSLGSTESTKAALHRFQERVQQAKDIAIVGAGPTGLELAGQLAAEYGQEKRITLVSAQRLCPLQPF
jgi:NADH dehydrogenase FAD-containing subunit